MLEHVQSPSKFDLQVIELVRTPMFIMPQKRGEGCKNMYPLSLLRLSSMFQRTLKCIQGHGIGLESLEGMLSNQSIH
jgi:hypothetical protein